jgi:hypothetical protein
MTKYQYRFLGYGLLAAALVAAVVHHPIAFTVIGHIHISAFHVKLPEFIGFHVKIWEFALEVIVGAIAVGLFSLSKCKSSNRDSN